MSTTKHIFVTVAVLMVLFVGSCTAAEHMNTTTEGDNITLLEARYDRDNDGILSTSEMEVIYHDYMHYILTPTASEQFVELLGFIPEPASVLFADSEKRPPVQTPNPPYDFEYDEVRETSDYFDYVWSDDRTVSVDSVVFLHIGNRNNVVFRSDRIQYIGVIGDDNNFYVPAPSDPVVYEIWSSSGNNVVSYDL